MCRAAPSCLRKDAYALQKRELVTPKWVPFLCLLSSHRRGAQGRSRFSADMAFRGSASTPRSQLDSLWLRISRSSQLDAAQIDQSNVSMLKEQLKRVFSTMPNFFANFEPELMACLHLCVWRFSVWMDKPTPGHKLKNLRYRNEGAFQSLLKFGKVKTGLEGPGLSKKQKTGFLLFMVGVPYCWARLQMLEHIAHQDIAARVMRFLERFYKVANLANLVLFLNAGRYHSIADRVLKARLVYQEPNKIQVTTSELFNRQLVWGELSELLLILLPLLKRVPSWLCFKWGYARATAEDGACATCAAKPITIPYAAKPCGHLYCYYCLSTRCSSYRPFHCAYCNKEVTNMQRFKSNEHEIDTI